MTELPTVGVVLNVLSEALGQPRIRVMDPELHMDEASLRWDPGAGGLLIWVVDEPLADAVFAFAATLSQVTEVIQSEVQEGVLVVGHLEVARAARRHEDRLRSKPLIWPTAPTERHTAEKRSRTVPPAQPPSLAAISRRTSTHANRASVQLDPPRPSWVAGALAMELQLPAGIEPDLVTVDVDGVQLCRAEALVVFGHRPQLFLPGMAVLASGPSERRFEGSLSELLDAVETWTPATMDARITRAAVLYALTHRSLEIADRAFPIEVELGERLVVRFPPGGTGLAAQLAVAASHARDPLLDIDVWGGRPRLRDGVLTVGLPAPAKQPYLAAEERERQVIDLLRAEGPLSTASMLEQLGWTRSSLRRVLAGLVASGTIETELATQSPGQRYRLPE